MPTIFIGRWIRGAGKFLRMGTTELTKTSVEQRREQILHFWGQHGLAAATDAFSVRRSTLFEWQRRQKIGRLAPESRRPFFVRTPEYSDELVAKIRTIRLATGFGKTKIAAILCREGRRTSESTVGRIITKFKLPKPLKQIKLKRERRPIRRLRKPKDFKSKSVGELVGLDTIVLNYFGFRFYIIVAIDWFSRIAVARCYSNPSSKNAADLLTRMQLALGTKIKSVNTDNGSEFLKNFILACEEMKIIHYFNYPRCPKMNAITERFNRTLQTETEWPELGEPLSVFNQQLLHFLMRYNFYRPHFSLENKTPVEIFIGKKSRMYWTHTAIFYNDTSHYYCYCDGTNDVKLHDPTTACF